MADQASTSSSAAAAAPTRPPRSMSSNNHDRLHPILTSNLRGGTNASGNSHNGNGGHGLIPSSPVSPLLSNQNLPSQGPTPTTSAEQASNKAFLQTLDGGNGASSTAASKDGWSLPIINEKSGESATGASMDDARMMEAGATAKGALLDGGQEMEEMEFDTALAASAHAGEWTHDEMEFTDEQLALMDDALIEGEWVEETEEEEEEEEQTPTPQPTSADGDQQAQQLTREQKQALDEKAKAKKKAAEMRYLVNAMYRCRSCMPPPFDMQQGFDHSAPPLRPPARPSAGPGSEYCCAYPALIDALPLEFPVDLVPLIHSYLLTEHPSRSFLTNPPLPSQGTIQCYILKTNTKFELYLEMKNQPEFVKMRTEMAQKEKLREERANARKRRIDEQQQPSSNADQTDGNEQTEEMKQQEAETSVSSATSSSTDQQHQQQQQQQQTQSQHSSSASASSSNAPNVPPVDVDAGRAMPPVTSLDDSEIGLRSPPAATPMTDSTPDATSPNEMDYEKFFPEQQRKAKKRRRLVRSAHNSPLLRPLNGMAMSASSTASPLTGSAAASPALQRLRLMNQRRMSAPSALSLGPSFVGSSPCGLPASSLSMLHGRTSASKGLTAELMSRRICRERAGSFPAVSSAVHEHDRPRPSISALRLATSRVNAVNTMLKHHSESIIKEGKDIFLLCAQRKRSWVGNHYIISNDRDCIKAEGPSFFGKLKSNFGGTEFTATDNGTKSPNKKNVESTQAMDLNYPTVWDTACNQAQQQQQQLQVHSQQQQQSQTQQPEAFATKALRSSRSLLQQAAGAAAASASAFSPSNWLSSGVSAFTGSSNNTNQHVRHELAVILYDHFFEHTGSPIRIKVLLPNRSFDLQTEAAVSGSLLKQYRMECERNEKRKAELEAKQQAAAAAASQEKKSSQEESSSANDEDHPSDDTNTTEDVPMTDADTAQPPTATASTQSTASASSSSSHSASVAPALPESASEVESAPKCSIDAYENLRPVWHDGMNAYVLHFDHHRVREKSVKNFRVARTIPDPENPGQTKQVTVLQFGRTLDRNVFIMDYGYPLDARTAFMICLSSIDPKLAV